MTDEEWTFFAPFVIATGGKRGRPPEDHRRVLDGVFWIARTGAPWRDLHEYFGKWWSVYRQFRRWTLAKNPESSRMTLCGPTECRFYSPLSGQTEFHGNQHALLRIQQSNIQSSTAPAHTVNLWQSRGRELGLGWQSNDHTILV
jgi:hypothetical protein